ncbi:MAG TPA: hypothetical protein ENH82_18800 [bacterium]|nr:hypothetical protein [bacterium]
MITNSLKRLHINTMLKILAVFFILAVLNHILVKMGIDTGTQGIFPISIFFGPTVHWSGLPYTVLFFILLFPVIKYSTRFNIFQVWVVGLILIMLGNLAQGGFDEAFYKPFYDSDIQYYHEAVRITDCGEWLNSFNDIQPELSDHGRTHPPFAVLLHYVILNIGTNNLLLLTVSFILLSSLTIILIWQIMAILGLSKQQCSQFALLFSLIPAFNIYSAVSFDSVIAMCSTMCLLGIISTVKRGINLSGTLLIITGILVTNSLTFGGTFLLATTGLITIKEIIVNKRYGLMTALVTSIFIGILLHIAMLQYFGYDHIKAFLTASKLENENGFLALHAPFIYFITRLEDVGEIALFSSIGILSLLFHYDYRQLRVRDILDDVNTIFLAGVFTLALMFLAGAYKTGETARACLYIYPFLMIALRNLDQQTLRSVILVAGLQTIIMQTFGGYFW